MCLSTQADKLPLWIEPLPQISTLPSTPGPFRTHIHQWAWHHHFSCFHLLVCVCALFLFLSPSLHPSLSPSPSLSVSVCRKVSHAFYLNAAGSWCARDGDVKSLCAALRSVSWEPHALLSMSDWASVALWCRGASYTKPGCGDRAETEQYPELGSTEWEECT